MKKFYFYCFASLLVLTANAESILAPAVKKTVFEHLFEVNHNWNEAFLSESKKVIQFDNDVDRISFHLLKVEQLLRSKSTAKLTSQQRLNREKTLEVLHDYALAKEFPINTNHKERTPYFIDIYGTHCAVGFLVQQSGFGHISLDISARQNYSYVRDIDSPKLLKWTNEFGFELEELALIQPGYPSAITYSQVGEGVNGRVKTLAEGSDGTIYLGGDFTQIGESPCNHVAYYQNNQLSCLGGGLDGIVNDVKEINGRIFVAGKFSHNGNEYPIAIFENQSWEFVYLDEFPNAEGTAISSFGARIAITNPNNHGVLMSEGVSGWNKGIEYRGRINTMTFEPYSQIYTYGGLFDTLFVSQPVYHQEYDEYFYEPDTVLTKNVAQLFNSYIMHEGDFVNLPIWTSYLINVPDTVYCSYSAGNSTYIGGSSNSEVTNSTGVIFSRLINGVSQPLATINNFPNYETYMSVYAIDGENNQSKLLIGGILSGLENMSMTMTQNTYYYDPTTNFYNDAGYILAPVYSVLMTSSENFIGGDFTQASWSSPANHIARTSHHLDVEENEINLEITLFPNPTSDYLHIELSNSVDFDEIQITDLAGKKIKVPFENNQIDVSALKTAVYFINLMKDGQIISVNRFIKN